MQVVSSLMSKKNPVLATYRVDEINQPPTPISEITKFIIKTYITRQRRPSIGLISRKKILPGPLVPRLGQAKGPDDPHLILLIFSSARL